MHVSNNNNNNGVNARCIKCACVKRKKPCLNCLPQCSGTCCNTILLRQEQAPKNTDTILSSSLVSINSPAWDRNEDTDSPNPPCSSCHPLSPLMNNSYCLNASAVASYPHGASNIEELVNTAFGASLIQSQGSDPKNVWHRRWLSIVHHSGKLYNIPGGSIGRKYIDCLTQEGLYLSAGNYPSDHIIVFSSIILQRDCMVRKGQDVRRVLARLLSMWSKCGL